MKLARVLALFALLLTVGPAVLFAVGSMAEGTMKLLMLTGTLLWFATAPRWLRGTGS